MERNTYNWLYKFKNPGIEYFVSNTEDYRVSLGKIVNKIKHEQARLRGITIKMDQQSYIGYFVEITGLNKNNISKLPDSKIHPLGTAFSFSRDLPFHFYNLYEISHYLKKSLELSFQEFYDISIENRKTEVNYPDFGEIAKRLSDLDIHFFMDEYSKPQPLIIYTDKEDNKKLTIKIDETWYKSYIPEVIEVYWLYEPDGVTEYCAMPYYDYLLRYLPIKSWPKLLHKEITP